MKAVEYLSFTCYVCIIVLPAKTQLSNEVVYTFLRTWLTAWRDSLDYLLPVNVKVIPSIDVEMMQQCCEKGPSNCKNGGW